MNFFRKISPFYTPPDAEKKGGLFVTREKILQTVLLVFALLGVPTAALASIINLRSGSIGLVVIYISVVAVVIGLLIFRGIPYSIRGRVTVLLIYGMALSEFVESGQLGEVRMFLIAYSALTAVFFDYKSVIGAITLGTVTIAGAGVYAASTPTPIIPALAHINEGTNWATSLSMFLLISSALSGSITMIIAGLDANLVRQADLAKRLEIERSSLEERIRLRTDNLERRMAQLHAASEISRTISELGDPELMLSRVVDLVKEHFKLYYAGVFLLDESRQNAVLRAGTGEAGQQMITNGHHLVVGGSSMVGWAIANRRARIALDVGSEAVRFNNPHLPLTRSELALPIITRSEAIGALTVQSAAASAFDEDDIAVLQNVADSLAIALENDRLYHEARQSLEEIRTLNRAYLQQSWNETIERYGSLAYTYENPYAPQGGQAAASIQVPLTLRNEVLGTISLEMDRPTLSSDEAAFIDNVTTQTAIALENARLLIETEQRAIQEQKLNEMTARFSRAFSVDEVLKAAVQQLSELPAVAEVSIQLQPASPRPAQDNGKNGSVNRKEITA